MPEVRLIDRNALKSDLCSGCGTHDACVTVCRAIRVINRQPTIAAEPVKHGQWIKEYQYLYGGEQWVNQYCSLCEMHTRQRIRDGLYKFCPHCGGRMDGNPESEAQE